MGRLILFICFSFFLSGCKKDQLKEVEKPITVNTAFRQGELSEFLELLKFDRNGAIRLSYYNYNFSKTHKYAVLGTFDEVLEVDKVLLNETVIYPQSGVFQHDDGLLEIGLQTIDPIPDFFGMNLSYQLESSDEEIVLSDELFIPSALELYVGIEDGNPKFFTGYQLKWNAAPENELGLYIIFEFDPVANTHLENPPFSEGKHIWYINVEDDGSYTFSESDFPAELPDGASIGMRAIRATYKDYVSNDGNFRFVAHSEVHGMFKYVPN